LGVCGGGEAIFEIELGWCILYIRGVLSIKYGDDLSSYIGGRLAVWYDDNDIVVCVTDGLIGKVMIVKSIQDMEAMQG
jgi:hypothetical protein